MKESPPKGPPSPAGEDVAKEERTAPSSREDGKVPSVPLEIAPGAGYHLRIVLRTESRTPGVYPFVTLGANGRYARVHLAQVVGGDGVPLRYLALKVQRDRYDVETDRGNVLSNIEIAQLWDKEYRRLRSLRECEDSPAAEILLESEGLPVLPPLVYCRHRQSFFRPPCPSCGSALRDCEDNGLLTRRDLPRHSQSNIRYLWCETCHRADPESPLYRHQANERERKAGVRGWKELCEGWRPLAQDGAGARPDVLEGFTCRGCPAYKDCYQAKGDPSALALQRLAPFSLFNFRIIPIEALRLSYEEFADCLGGISWKDFLQEHRGNREAIPEQVFLADLRSQLARPDRFLFSGAGGLEAVEVLRLKLVLFTQLCRRIRDFHFRFREPHLDLKPENVMVEVPPVSPELPYLWNFRAKLIDLAATTDFPYGEEGEMRSMPAPPVNYSEIYTSPLIRQGLFGHLKPCDIQFSGLKDLGDERRQITARLRSTELIAEEFTDKDVFRVSVNQAEVGEPLSFWATKAPGAEAGSGSMEIIGEPMHLKAGTLASLEYLGTQWVRNVNFETYHAFGVVCDLYSAGVILLRTLLCGKRQNMAVVSTKLLQPVLNELRRLKDSLQESATPGELTEKVRGILAANPSARPEMVYWDGEPARPNGIPADLWYDALVLAVRMCTNFPGFSYCAGRGDFDREHPERTMDSVVSDLERLGARAHSALFAREELNREVREAIGRVRERLGKEGKT